MKSFLRPVILPFLAGAAGAAALAPLMLWPLMLLSYAVLVRCLLRAETAKQAFRQAWWWGFGYFLAGLYWISISLTVDMARFGWMIPFALFGLNGAFALFPALAGLVSFRLKPAESMLRHLAVIVLCLFAAEWLRGHILTGFPWNLPGYVWLAHEATAQWFSVAGIYPLTALTIACGGVLALVAESRKWLMLPAGVVAVLFAGGFYLAAQPVQEEMPPMNLRVVQANIAQSLKWDPQFQYGALLKHISLSQQEGELTPDVIVWPESSYPYILKLNESAPEILTSWLRPGQVLLFGAVTADSEAKHYYNSMVAVNAGGEIVGVYHKRHLVPFGEYVPLRDYLPLERIAPGAVDFTPAAEAEGVMQPGNGLAPVMPLICYEAVFPRYSDAPQAQWLVNITNDAWFGNSSGPYQHLQMARARAIEQGRPLVRAANTGISAVFDVKGRVLASLPLGSEGVIDLRLNQIKTTAAESGR
jgi:apolipoprotein N-acyltransferase